MENTFLKGNENIKQAIENYHADVSEETIMGVIHAIQNRILEQGHFLIPGDYTENEDNPEFLMKTITSDDGMYLIAFTDEEELRKGPETGIMSNFIDSYIGGVLDAEGIKGLVINPFGSVFYLPKNVLQIIMEIKETEYEYGNELLNKAIIFATERHAGQVRKGTTIPYITHPLETMTILNAMKADTYLLMAGVLHDVLEDTDTTGNEILERFGTDVMSLVAGHSEDKSKTWKERKETAIRECAEASFRMKMLIMADKTANLRSMYNDFKLVGNKLWERFNADKELQAWYYSNMIDSLAEMQYDPNTKDIYWEMNCLFKDLFVDYYLDEGKGMLYQVCADGTTNSLKKTKPQWISYEGTLPRKTVGVTRQYAERLEDNWMDPFWDVLEHDLSVATYDLFLDYDKYRTGMTINEEGLSFLQAVINPNTLDSKGSPMIDDGWVLDYHSMCRFLLQLRMKHGIRNKLSTILKKEFGGENSTEAFLNFCESIDVQSQPFEILA